MSKLRVESLSISMDGFGAGPNQSLENPMGVAGMALHQWVFPTKSFQQMHGSGQGTTGVDDDFAARGVRDIGAWIMGRNMFGPIRGTWSDTDWKGWWGNNPPYHVPVFVLTHYPHEPMVMEGDTAFYFVTDGIDRALERAQEVANGMDIRLGGGIATIKQYLRARLIDEMHLAIAPILLGAGENLFSDIDLPSLGYYVVEHVATPNATHVVLKKTTSG